MVKRKNFLVPKKETFICQNCQTRVAGGRYINHCSKCLWSKHVDKDIPGDRLSSCQGLMKPIEIVRKGNRWRIIHHCQQCGKKTIVDTRPKDNFDLITKLASKNLNP